MTTPEASSNQRLRALIAAMAPVATWSTYAGAYGSAAAVRRRMDLEDALTRLWAVAGDRDAAAAEVLRRRRAQTAQAVAAPGPAPSLLSTLDAVYADVCAGRLRCLRPLDLAAERRRLAAWDERQAALRARWPKDAPPPAPGPFAFGGGAVRVHTPPGDWPQLGPVRLVDGVIAIEVPGAWAPDTVGSWTFWPADGWEFRPATGATRIFAEFTSDGHFRRVPVQVPNPFAGAR